MRSRMTAAGAGGFTLIEMMIAVAVAAGISAATFSVYRVQQRSYLMQEQIVDLQQNVRAFLFFIEKDLRMAGYDPRKTSCAGFLIANPYEVVFTADLGRPKGSSGAGVDCKLTGCDNMPDGEIIGSPCTNCVVETIRYALKSTTAAPVSASGTNTGQVTVAGKTTSVHKTFNGTTGTDPNNPAQDVVENVEALEFLYNLSNGTAVTVAAGTDLARIRSVTVSVLMRTRNQIAGYGQPDRYQYPASNAAHSTTGKRWGPYTDPYMRRVVITNIQCRNMALQVED